ncbi:MAG: FecR family protein [Runella sp.]
MKNNLSKEQLFAHFAGNSSVLTKHQLEEWLQSSPSHQEIYYACLEEWERQHLYWHPNTEAEYEKLQQRIRETTQTTIGIEPISRPKWQLWTWRIAASVVLLLVASYLLKDTIWYKSYSTEYGKIQNIILEDGSVVNLNANSTLRVPRFGFGPSTREVLLEGEAYFSVTHTATHQKFVVSTSKDFRVEVLGTEFSVRNRSRGTQVMLDKGKVKIHYGQNTPSITMKPGDLVTYDSKGKVQIEQVKRPEKYIAWRSHRFVFEQNTLQEVAIMIEENYGLKVEIQNKEVANRSISGEIEAHNADELLEALSEVFELNIHRNGRKIFIQMPDNQ